MGGGDDVDVWKLWERGGGSTFVALRHAEKASPQRQDATTGERASVPPYGVQASRRLSLPHSHM